MKTRSLYIIKCNEFYKIGVSADLKLRVNQLATSNPYDLELIYSISEDYDRIIKEYLNGFKLDTRSYRNGYYQQPPATRLLERKIHKDMERFKVRGEWYKIPDKELKALLSELGDCLSVSLTSNRY